MYFVCIEDSLWYHLWYQCVLMYDIIPNAIVMISWYDAIISYTKSYYIKCTWNIYDIITEGMISYMITDMISSFYFIWYWVYLWYHTFSYDIIDNIIYMILCMILQYDITRQISWYCKWYHRQYHMIWSVLKNSMIS